MFPCYQNCNLIELLSKKEPIGCEGVSRIKHHSSGSRLGRPEVAKVSQQQLDSSILTAYFQLQNLPQFMRFFFAYFLWSVNL